MLGITDKILGGCTTLIAVGMVAATAAAVHYRDQANDEQGRRLETERALRVSMQQAQATADSLSALAKSTARTNTITKELTREVQVRIPADSCPLPADWRVLHDAAAADVSPAPSGPAGGASAPAEAAQQ